MRKPCLIDNSVMLKPILLWTCLIMVLSCQPGLTQATFTDQTATMFPTSGELVQGYWVGWGDYNGDGYVDFSDYGRLFKNNGGTGFTWVVLCKN